MPGHDIIVIGASAGGLEAVSEVVAGLPANLPAALFVVIHGPSGGPGMLAHILNRRGNLPALYPGDGDTVESGHVYVAPPDSHLLLQPGAIRLVRGPRENGFRPAVDPLFRTAARAFGPRVVGVVLSGTLDDGSAGLLEIKRHGGVTIVQDPEDALYRDMPENALNHLGQVDHCLPAGQIAAILDSLSRQEVAQPQPEASPAVPEAEEDAEESALDLLIGSEKTAHPSQLACPDCGGVLWELEPSGELLRFRCRVGHVFSSDGLRTHQSRGLEAALWSAVRTLEESAALSRRLARKSRNRGSQLTAERFDRRAEDAEEQASTIEQMLLKPSAGAMVDDPEAAGDTPA